MVTANEIMVNITDSDLFFFIVSLNVIIEFKLVLLWL